MASKRVIKRLQDKIGSKQPQQGLPIINQMMADEGPEGGREAIGVAGKWMTDIELESFASLLDAEGMFIACNCMDDGKESPQEFIDSYGVDDESDEYYHTKGMTPEDAILKVTEETPSWGEWIGGCVGNFRAFPLSLRKRLRPVLINAILWAEENGVDH